MKLPFSLPLFIALFSTLTLSSQDYLLNAPPPPSPASPKLKTHPIPGVSKPQPKIQPQKGHHIQKNPKELSDKFKPKERNPLSHVQQMDSFEEQLHNIRTQPQQKRGPILLDSGKFSAKHKAFSRAEKLFHEALKYQLSDKQKKETLLLLANLYDDQNLPSKTAITLEKFIDSFPNGQETAEIYLKLGKIYRNMSAYDKAIARFYKVFDLALSIDKQNLQKYRDLSNQAQLEITDTYFMTEQYDKVIKLANRLKGLNLPKTEQERILFKSAYSQHYLKQLDNAVAALQEFLQKFPKSTLAPQVHYILISSYNDMNRPDVAIEQMITFLKIQPKPDPEIIANWTHWKRKITNDLANQLYEEEDFISALKVYQTMATLSSKPNWQWPVIYQIGRCYERLQMREKAIESYQVLVSGNEWKDQKFLLTEDLKAIQETAKWRLNHIAWLKKSNKKLTQIIQPKLKKI